jgi:hypothetical protein
MTIVYALISVNSTVLAEHATATGRFVSCHRTDLLLCAVGNSQLIARAVETVV